MNTSLIPTTGEWAMIKEQTNILVKTNFLPSSIRTPEQAIAIMLKGREVGVPPMQAFAAISVINGKPALGAELMLGLIYRKYPKADIRIVKNEKDGAEVHAKRPGSEHLQKFAFTLEDAKQADVLSKDSWRKYPKNMYLWRAISSMARACFPDCLMGLSHTPEELGAEVDDEGEVIDIEVHEPTYEPEFEEPAPPPVKVTKPKVIIFNKTLSTHRGWLSGALHKDGFSSAIYKDVEKALHGRPTTDARAVAEEIVARAQVETPEESAV